MTRRRYLLSCLSPQFRKLLLNNIFHDIIPDTIQDRNTRNQGVDKLYLYEGNGEIENQLVDNGDFSNGTNEWYNDNSTFSVADNVATITPTAQFGGLSQFGTFITGHKYFVSINLKSSGSGSDIIVSIGGQYGGDSARMSGLGIDTNWKTCKAILTMPTNTTSYSRFRVFDNSTSYNAFYCGDYYCVDLTIRFGTGNEPTSLDDKRIKKIIAEGYRPKNEGTYKGSVVESIETRGFNLFDEETELGALDTTSGANVYTTSQIRTKNYNKIKGGETYYCKNGGSGSIWALFYDVNNNVITGLSNSSVGAIAQSNNAFQIENHTFTAPLNCCYIRFYLTVSYGTTYNHDICIYRAGNIWNENWERGGINSATGQNESWNNGIRSVDYMQVSSNTSYFDNTGLWIAFYDKDKNYLGYLGGTNGISKTFTTANNCCFIRFTTNNGYGTTYKGDIKIFRANVYMPFASFNLWNEQVEAGGFDTNTGEKIVYANTLRSVNKCYCEPNKTYYIKSNVAVGILFYKQDGTYISVVGKQNETFTTPSNAYYFNVSFAGTTYHYDICINKSDPKKNGLYLRFGVLDTIKLPAPLNLNGAINSRDRFEITKDNYVFTRNVWNIDLSTITFTQSGVYRTAIFNDIKDAGTDSHILHKTIMCEKYFEEEGYSQSEENSFSTLNKQMWIKTSVPPTGLMSYALATPQVITIPKKHLKAIKLDGLSWNKSSERFYAQIVNQNVKPASNDSAIANIYCVRYKTDTNNNTYSGANDMSISLNGQSNPYVGIVDKAKLSMTTTEFAQTLSDLYIFVETENEVEDFVNEEIYQRGGEINAVGEKYFEVEYLESSGTQYIDTGINATLTMKINVVFQALTLASDKYIFGTGDSDYDRFYFGLYQSPVKWLIGSGYYAVGSNADSNKHDFSLDLVNSRYELDGTQTSVSIHSGTNFTNYSIKLFNRCRTDGIVRSNEYSSIKLFSCQIFDNGSIVRDFVPAIRQSDNVAGLYDRVTGKFFTNKGTGTFATGNIVGEFDSNDVLPNIGCKFQVK